MMLRKRSWLNWFVHLALVGPYATDGWVFQRRGKRNNEVDPQLPPEQFGRPKAPAGTWGSCIRIIDPVQGTTVGLVKLDNNEAAFSIAVVPFSTKGSEPHLVVGTGQDTVLSPRSCTSGFLRTYTFTNGGTGLELLHKTETDDVPLAVMAFQGRLVAGVGKALRIYDMGKKKLLRKVENKVWLHSHCLTPVVIDCM